MGIRIGIGNSPIIGSDSRGWNPLLSITNLAYSVKSATSVYLSWTLPAETFTGVRVYSSTDGVTYAQVGADLANTATNYTHNSIDAGSARYWYVVMFKGSTEGGASSVVSLDWFTMQATTTGAATLSLALVNVVAGDGTTIFWGDGTADSYTSANNASAKTRAYAGAGTYVVKIANPLNISEINFNSAILTNFNSNQYLKCGDNLARITHSTALISPTINSADMAHLKLSSQLFLAFTQPGTYAINSDHFKAYTLSSTLFLTFTQAGTYTINSDHFKAYTLSSTLQLNFTQAGTYAIARADITYVRVVTVVINIPSLATSTDLILLGFYDRLAAKTNTGGTINLTGCPAPTGTYQAMVPPTTGKEAAYELINDSGGVTTKEWATITVTGGGTP